MFPGHFLSNGVPNMWKPMLVVFLVIGSRIVSGDDLNSFYHHDGPLKGTLKSDQPLPLYDANREHLWNRMFAAFYIRPRLMPQKDVQPPVTCYEGGDAIEFLAWGKTEYWSSAEAAHRVTPLLDEFLDQRGERLHSDTLKRAVFQHDLWAVYDHLIDQNIKRRGDLATRKRRDELCEKLAQCLRRLALSTDEIASLPDTYAAAVKSGEFVPNHDFDPHRHYLPHHLLDDPETWVEIDFHQPQVHEDISDRFVTLHAESLQGRSYYRIFYRFPKGRGQVVDYLKELETKGIDWRHAANNGFVATRKDAPAIPLGTEVVLLQLMMTMDDQLRPVPTKIVESFQFRVFRNLDGSPNPYTNTGAGVNILDYRMKRHRLFNHLKAGGLEREPEAMPQYRVAIDGIKATAPDWGFAGKEILFQQCVDCHMSPRLDRLGVASVPSIINSGGFDSGAQIGVAHPLEPHESDVTGKRVAKYKSRHESFRRLLEHLGE
jgi:hypothetical protein